MIVKPPYAKVGDIVTFKGQGIEWTVTKVKTLDPSKNFSLEFKRNKAGNMQTVIG